MQKEGNDKVVEGINGNVVIGVDMRKAPPRAIATARPFGSDNVAAGLHGGRLHGVRSPAGGQAR